MKPKLKPMDTVDGQWTMDEAPSASALSAISTYESEEEQEELLRMTPHQGAKDPSLE